jgi:hypothetical protein
MAARVTSGGALVFDERSFSDASFERGSWYIAARRVVVRLASAIVLTVALLSPI